MILTFIILVRAVPELYAASRDAELKKVYPNAYGHGDGNPKKLHSACTNDDECGGEFKGDGKFGPNSFICKTFTVSYKNGSKPWVGGRCEGIYCPGFSGIMLNANEDVSIEDIAKTLQEAGPSKNVSLNMPSPAVNPWDPRQAKCVKEEADTAKPCTVP